MIKTKKTINSWLHAYEQSSTVIEVNTVAELQLALFEGECKIVGKFHSYNRAALHDRTVILGEGFKSLHYDSDTQTCKVGAASTIREVMEYLLIHGRRLPNSGNMMQQTFVGACKTGTHGFGLDACMSDCVIEIEYIARHGSIVKTKGMPVEWIKTIGRPILSMRIKTLPLSEYVVTNSICRLSELLKTRRSQDKNLGPIERSYLVLPYSGVDPVCVVADYQKSALYFHQVSEARRAMPWDWFKLRAFWAFDNRFPWIANRLSRMMNLATGKTWKTRTELTDLDFRYDVAPGVSLDTMSFKLWAMKPTFQLYNTALFFKPEETRDAIREAIRFAQQIKPGLLRSFIGIRQLSDPSTVPFAGNYLEPRHAMDLYCAKPKAGQNEGDRDCDYLIRVQRHLQREFDTRPHLGKTVR